MKLPRLRTKEELLKVGTRVALCAREAGAILGLDSTSKSPDSCLLAVTGTITASARTTDSTTPKKCRCGTTACNTCNTLFLCSHPALNKQTSPELFGKLLLGDEMSTARSTAAPSAPQPSKSLRPAHSAGRSAASMHRTPSRGGQIGAMYDTPRGYGGDEPLSVDQELAIELESVKKERQQLMESIAQVKAEAGACSACWLSLMTAGINCSRP